jgi:hypothetical protein
VLILLTYGLTGQRGYVGIPTASEQKVFDGVIQHLLRIAGYRDDAILSSFGGTFNPATPTAAGLAPAGSYDAAFNSYAPSFDASSAIPLGLGQTNATQVNIGKPGVPTTLGGGSAVNQIYRATTGSIALGALTAGTTTTFTFAIAGVVVAGSSVAISPTTALAAGVSVYAYVSAAGVVTIAVTAAATVAGGNATFNLTVTQ